MLVANQASPNTKVHVVGGMCLASSNKIRSLSVCPTIPSYNTVRNTRVSSLTEPSSSLFSPAKISIVVAIFLPIDALFESPEAGCGRNRSRFLENRQFDIERHLNKKEEEEESTLRARTGVHFFCLGIRSFDGLFRCPNCLRGV